MIAAYEVISEFVGPATMQQPVAQSVVGDVPIVAPAVAPTTSQAPAPLETVSRGSRPRAPAAKVTLPIIGSHAGLPSPTTDGRGGEGLAGGASAPSLIREEGEPRQPLAQEAGVGEAKPAATERPVKPRKRIVRKERERPTSYAARSRPKGERSTRDAARYRQGPVYPTVSQTASWY